MRVNISCHYSLIYALLIHGNIADWKGEHWKGYEYNDLIKDMWGDSGGVTKKGISLHPFSEVRTCRQCVWSREWKRWPHRWPHKSISQPSSGTCNKSLVSPRPRFVSTAPRGREHGRVYGMENQSSTCQVTPPSSSSLSFPDSRPLDEHPSSLWICPYKYIVRTPLNATLWLRIRMQSINGINYVPQWVSFRSGAQKWSTSAQRTGEYKRA